jgi:hypothetical protein
MLVRADGSIGTGAASEGALIMSFTGSLPFIAIVSKIL